MCSGNATTGFKLFARILGLLRRSVPEATMQLDASLLEPPDHAERAICVRPDDALAEVLTRIRTRLLDGGPQD